MKYLFIFFNLALSQIIPFDQTLPVLFNPVVQVKAGGEISYQLANFRNATCEATVTFHNSTFLSFTMLALPKECAGDQYAKLRIPESVPNGVMAVEWECSGSQATKVDLMVVMNGTGDFETFLHDTEEAAVVVMCRVNTTAPSGC